MDAKQLIIEELDTLKGRAALIDMSLARLQGEIERFSKERNDVSVQLRLLDTLLARARGEDKSSQAAASGGKSTTDWIMEFVTACSGGVTGSQVADALEDKIESKSEDKRRLIHNMLINLRNAGRLKQEEGRYFLAN